MGGHRRLFQRGRHVVSDTMELRDVGGPVLLGRDCVSCGPSPSCNCSSDEHCILTSRTCSQCPQIQCLKNSTSHKGGVNPGVIAGPIVAVLIILSLALFWWLRKKKRRDLQRLEQMAARARKAESAGFALSHHDELYTAASRASSARSPTSSQPPLSASRRSPLSASGTSVQYTMDNASGARTFGMSRQNSDPFSDGKSASSDGVGSQSTNVIPIQYVSNSGGQSGPAQKLDEARQNLLRPDSIQPLRPSRSADLNLRLDPKSPNRAFNKTRESYNSGHSGAPSFLSGNSYDMHNDMPRIVTSKQVKVGRLQQAEVVQFGKAIASSMHGILSSPDPDEGQAENGTRTPTPATFGGRIAPSSPGYGTEEGLRAEDEPPSAGSTDLRFSMGSLAYRDSMSSMGTSRYLAQPDVASVHGSSRNLAQAGSLAAPPRLPNANAARASGESFGNSNKAPARESTLSTGSYADSVLSGFPMIPPTQPGSSSLQQMPSGLPQSTSVNTLQSHGTPSRPPAAYKAPARLSTNSATETLADPGFVAGRQQARRPSGTSFSDVDDGGRSPAKTRPVTAASMADSFLGSFPFVPPNMDDLAELPTAALPTAAVPETARR